VDRAEFEDYRRHRQRVWYWLYYAGVAASLGVGLAVSSLWSFIGGAVLAVVLIAAVTKLLLRLNTAVWIKRFPELDDPRVTWTRDRDS